MSYKNLNMKIKLNVKVVEKDTGKVEEYDIVGTLNDDQLKELTNGSDALDSGTERSD